MVQYEVVLGPAAEAYMLSAARVRRLAIADCLRTELCGGPNAGSSYTFSWDGVEEYTATPLTYNGIVVVHRRLNDVEMRGLRKKGRLERGVRSAYLIVDFLSPESGIYLRCRV